MTTAREILFDGEARAKLLSGVEKLADWMAPALGPQGLSRGPHISLDDQFEEMGRQMAWEVSQKIKEKVGDGTTTGILLLRALARSGVRYINAGASPVKLKKGMEKGVEALVEALTAMAKPVPGWDELYNIATLSASGNGEVGHIVAQTLGEVGQGGVVTIVEGEGTETAIERFEGIRFDRGYLSPYFCTNTSRMEVEMHNPFILLVDKKINSIQELLPLLQMVATSGRELLIVAEDLEGDAIATLVVNRLNGTMRAAAVKAPHSKTLLKDLATLTGATLVSQGLPSTGTAVLGSAVRGIIDKDKTTIINESAPHGKIALVTVGGATEEEMMERKAMMEDSLRATRTAQESGVVAGGGVGLRRATQTIDRAVAQLKLEGEEALGANLVKRACEAPIRQLARNAGFDDSLIIAEVERGGENAGFNVLTHKIEDLLSAGVIDPVHVVIATLQAAAAGAGELLISEVLIGDASED